MNTGSFDMIPFTSKIQWLHRVSEFRNSCYTILICLITVLSSEKTQAQVNPVVRSDSVKDIYELSLQQLWNTPIEIASKKVQTQQEAPSIVTVITSEEIQKYGYRDIADVLRMVPGFEFGIDVQSLYGLGFRGIWAHEGKVLVMINGMSLNCFGFGNGNYFGTFPITLVDKIEILRGPGSAIHGGFAEVAVVNIVTKKGEMLNGSEIQGTVGSINGSLMYNGSISVGVSKVKVGVNENSSMDLAVNITSNSTPVSTDAYLDFFGNSFKMNNENSWKKFNGIYLTGGIGKLKFGYNRSYTNFLAQDGFGAVIPKSSSGVNTNELNNKIESFNLQYQKDITSKISCTPKLEIASGNPISSSVSANYFNTANGPVFFNTADPWQNQSVVGSRYQFEIEMQAKVSQRASIEGGVGYQYNKIRSITVTGNYGLQISASPGDTLSVYGKGTEYAYIQYSLHNNNIGFTVGGRYEMTPFGQAFAPRAGVTFVKSNFNAKVLYGRAYRVPLLWQAYSRQFYVEGKPLKPEFSNSFEMELGYKLTSNTKLSANLFYIDITSPIVYLGSDNSYQNFGRIQSMGIESEFQVKFNEYKGFVNFSFATPGKQTSKEFLNESKDAFLALPAIKANIGFYYTKGRFSLAPTVTYLGKRYGQSQFSALNSTITNVVFETTRYNPLLLLNVNCIVTLSKAFQFNITAGNLLNGKYVAIQPYYGSHAPMPAYNQQFSVGLKVKL